MCAPEKEHLDRKRTMCNTIEMQMQMNKMAERTQTNSLRNVEPRFAPWLTYNAKIPDGPDGVEREACSVPCDASVASMIYRTVIRR